MLRLVSHFVFISLPPPHISSSLSYRYSELANDLKLPSLSSLCLRCVIGPPYDDVQILYSTQDLFVTLPWFHTSVYLDPYPVMTDAV